MGRRKRLSVGGTSELMFGAEEESRFSVENSLRHANLRIHGLRAGTLLPEAEVEMKFGVLTVGINIQRDQYLISCCVNTVSAVRELLSPRYPLR